MILETLFTPLQKRPFVDGSMELDSGAPAAKASFPALTIENVLKAKVVRWLVAVN